MPSSGRVWVHDSQPVNEGGDPDHCPRAAAYAIDRRRPTVSGLTTSNDILDHLALDEGQPLIASEMRIGQPVLVQPELVQDRRVQVAEVIRLLDRPQADRVGCADDLASLDAAAGHPHREADVVVVAPLAGLCLRRAAEFAAPEDERALEQPSTLQVLEQAGDRLVGLGGFA